MKTIRLVIEYDGTAYVGWQVQANGVAVQEVVETAVARVVGHPVRLTSSGRTDAGVHARGMVAHFHTKKNLPPAAYREGVNRYLPAEIVVRSAVEAAPEFHARFDARGKWYRYRIWNDPVRSPLESRTSWHVPVRLDVSAMQQAASRLVGRHDFRAFRSSGCDARTSVRQLFSVAVHRAGALVVVDFRGDGYLRNMIRMMVGTLTEIGLHRLDPETIDDLLEGREGRRAGPTAPPQGLCLMEVWYE